MSLDASVGGSASNSYLTVAEADAYHTKRLFNSAWTSISDVPTKEAALEWATRVLDRQNWNGYRMAITQALRWPRAYVYDLDGIMIPSNIIPQFLKDATAELAFLLVQQDRTGDAGTEGFSSITVGPIKLDINSYDRITTLGPEVRKMIAGYCDMGVTLQRG